MLLLRRQYLEERASQELEDRLGQEVKDREAG